MSERIDHQRLLDMSDEEFVRECEENATIHQMASMTSLNLSLDYAMSASAFGVSKSKYMDSFRERLADEVEKAPNDLAGKSLLRAIDLGVVRI